MRIKKISTWGKLADLIPNNVNKYCKNCLVECKENYKFDVEVKGLSRPIQILVILCDFDYNEEIKYQPSFLSSSLFLLDFDNEQKRLLRLKWAHLKILHQSSWIRFSVGTQGDIAQYFIPSDLVTNVSNRMFLGSKRSEGLLEMTLWVRVVIQSYILFPRQRIWRWRHSGLELLQMACGFSTQGSALSYMWRK